MNKLDELHEKLPVISFETRDELHDWLLENENRMRPSGYFALGLKNPKHL
ncbi:hypothetical protein [Pseudoleptotrichia goodfellowii]|jgi:putative cesF|uniref:Uncharacterized protein n=1 Tax=Pseudoleptotrichia goodfellowii F0264 TaxID=596323 RepID=D0GIT5_9FUSO|nr:hypothetical protein [Pseudoleptotrichia goodfellowii]EEY35998.1 hypothetical protein HMPREF0554_0133 [Pseudoleptotrichia goodfellowii F0264]